MQCMRALPFNKYKYAECYKNRIGEERKLKDAPPHKIQPLKTVCTRNA